MSTKVSLLLLVVAILVGAGTAFGVFQYIETETKGLVLLTAARDIEPGDVVQAEMLKGETVPAQFEEFAKHAVKLSNAQAVIGRAVTQPIPQGNVVLYSHFDPVSPKREIFSRLEPGDRAMSLPVGLETSVANVVQPGDYVDVLATFDSTRFAAFETAAAQAGQAAGTDTESISEALNALRETGGESRVTGSSPAQGLQVRTILKRVPVLGVGQRFNDPRYRIDESDYSYNVVTVKVSELDAELLVFAQALGGRLTLTLRHPEAAEEETPAPPMDFKTFVNLTE